MNFITLQAGDAIYVPADAPHAYLSGDIVECMARSNNVLNTGFCPRADRDSIPLFTSALTFAPHSADETLLPSRSTSKGKNGKSVVYKPDMSEFDMLRTILGKKEKEVVAETGGPGVLIVTQGSGKLRAEGKDWEVREGYTFFIGQGVELTFESEDGLEIYLAYAE